MARVPTPVTQGAQRIGGETLGEARNPYMNVNAPVEAFGGGTGKALQEAGAAGMKAVEGLSDIAVKERRDAETLQLAEAQKKGSELEMRLTMEVSNRLGRGAIGIRHYADQEVNRHAAGYDTASMRPDQRLAMEKSLASLKNRVSLFAFSHEKKETDIHEKGLSAATIADASMLAAANYKAGPGVINQYLAMAAAGAERLADREGLTGAARELSVRTAKGMVFESMITRAISDGDVKEAEALLNATKGDPSKVETQFLSAAQATKLNAQLFPVKERKRGLDEFNAIVAAAGGDPLKIAEAVNATANDPVRYDRISTAYTNHQRLVSAQNTQGVKDEITNAHRVLAAGGQLTPGMLPTMMKLYPEAANSFLSGQQRFREIGEDNAAEARHRAAGGGTNSPIMNRHMDGVATTNPDEYIKTVRSPSFKRMVGGRQLATMLSKAKILEKNIGDAAHGEYNIVGVLTSRMGMKREPAREFYTKNAGALSEVVSEARRKALGAGRKPSNEDIDKALANHMIKVRGKQSPNDTFAGDHYSIVLGTGIPVGEAVLSNDPINHNILAMALGPNVSAEDVKKVMTAGWFSVAKRLTIAEVATALSRPTPHSLAVEAARLDALEDRANAAGFSWDFVSKRMMAKGLSMTPVAVEKELKALQANPKPYQEWIERGF
jgi:hypothetical protein